MHSGHRNERHQLTELSDAAEFAEHEEHGSIRTFTTTIRVHDDRRRTARTQARTAVAPTVLIVEDDTKLSGLIVRMLNRAGFATTVAHTGDAALQAMLAHPPAAAVVDIMIPHPDGLEVCRQFRRDGWHGPIVAISALNSPEHRLRAANAGADTFLAKPFRLTDLVSTIEAINGRTPIEP
jgi:CheY-like chemotaxis protein